MLALVDWYRGFRGLAGSHRNRTGGARPQSNLEHFTLRVVIPWIQLSFRDKCRPLVYNEFRWKIKAPTEVHHALYLVSRACGAVRLGYELRELFFCFVWAASY